MKHILPLLACCLFLTAGNLSAQYAMFTPPVLTPPANEYIITNMETINSPWLDYSAMPFKDGLIFTSARGGNSIFAPGHDLSRGRYSDLYFAKKDVGEMFYPPEMLTGDVNGRFHDGVATFTPDGETMIFSRNDRKGQNGEQRVDLKIYAATQKKNTWVDTREMPFNSNDFITCHPSLSKDGAMMFFASNRPGGYGGMDIYAVKKKNDGWSDPVNLGPEINTQGNEIFPFIAENEMLYFSSDGHQGLGGLDIYSSQMWGNVPGERMYLPAPLNSVSDDFAFFTNADETEGYLTSDRPGGKGSDDIYSWKFNGLKPVMATICVVLKGTGDRVEDARLSVLQAGNSVANMASGTDLSMLQLAPVVIDGQQYFVLAAPGNNGLTQTGKSCGVKVPVVPGSKYVVQVEKEGYEPVKIQVPFNELVAKPEYLVPLEVKKMKTFTGYVKTPVKDEPVPAVTVSVISSCTGEKMAVTSDSNGKFLFDVNCDCNYTIQASKEKFRASQLKWLLEKIPCDKDNFGFTLYMELVEEKLEVGTVIRLDNLYYDFDKYIIRTDAADDLDTIVSLMKRYPSMEIELGSHTDARGSDSYNQWLSQKRAEAAVKYIIDNGISTRRLTAKGYGETRLVNACSNGVNCSDAEHQENRRTEIKITRLDEPGVRVLDKK